ncbi:aldose 1-epimerase family protein [Lactobacillaceae bacterium Scapto_B20]
MVFTLSNDNLTITVNSKGAELNSVKGDNGIEYLWQGDPNFWGRHAPILFPIVGRLKNDQYEYDGNRYHLGQHGFARDMEFILNEQTNDSITMELNADEHTKQLYPFNFKLLVKYTLIKSTVRVDLMVLNTDHQKIYFSVGAHPAFNVPLSDEQSFDDYQIKVAPREEYDQIPLKNSLSDINDSQPLNLKQPLLVNRQLFGNDAVILNLHDQPVDIMLEAKDLLTKHGVSLNAENAEFMGLWSTYPKDAPFVCIEPWWGLADDVDSNGQLVDKKGIEQLDAGDQFDAQFDITIY